MLNRVVFERMGKLIPLIVYALFLLWALLPYYKNGSIILGGEGNFLIHKDVYIKHYQLTWYANCGKGIMTFTPSFVGFANIVLAWVQRIAKSNRLANFIPIFLTYYLPFLGSFLLARAMGASELVSTVVALFYCLTPFSLEYLSALLGSQLSMSFVPFAMLVIYVFFFEPVKLFLGFGFVSILFAAAYANPPTLAIMLFSCVFSVIASGVMLAPHLIVNNLLIIMVSFLLFNLSWIWPFLYMMKNTPNIYTKKTANEFLDVFVRDHGSRIARDVFNFRSITATDRKNNNLADWFRSSVSDIVLLLPAFILVLMAYKVWAIGLVIVALFFMVKGNAEPFGFIFSICFNCIPFFNMFKTPQEKFGFLFVFVFSIGLILALKSCVWCVIPLAIFVIYCAIPLLRGYILPDVVHGNGLVVQSRKFIDKPEYQAVKDFFHADNEHTSIILFPGGENYQVCFRMDNGKYYTGIDCIFKDMNKSLITPQEIFNFYLDIMRKDYEAYLALYNVKYIVVNGYHTTDGWFGSVEKFSYEQIRKRFQKFKRWDFGKITIFQNPKYMPKVYTSRFECSFKMISHVKYQVQVKDATCPFGLFLSENFNEGWIATSNEADISNHQKVQLYANGWEVAPKVRDFMPKFLGISEDLEMKGRDINITLYFKPQMFFNIGLVIKFITILISLILLWRFYV